jgi:mannose-6-phosphate isomerase-like protein (cupin superfamily)
MGEPELAPQSWGTIEETEMREGVSIRHLVISPGQRLPLCKNGDFPEHWVIVNGAGRVHLEDKDFLVETGSAVFIPPRTRFAIGNVGDSNLRLVAVHYGAERPDADQGLMSALRRLRPARPRRVSSVVTG